MSCNQAPCTVTEYDAQLIDQKVELLKGKKEACEGSKEEAVSIVSKHLRAAVDASREDSCSGGCHCAAVMPQYFDYPDRDKGQIWNEDVPVGECVFRVKLTYNWGYRSASGHCIKDPPKRALVPSTIPNDPDHDGEDGDYHHNDALIIQEVERWNAAGGCDECKVNEQRLPNLVKCPCKDREKLTNEVVKSWMIQESGSPKHKKIRNEGDAWQVNNQGDWDDKKKLCGLTKPPNGGDRTLTPETSLRAALCWLCYKMQHITTGKGSPTCKWRTLKEGLNRYNGKGAGDYAEKILERAAKMK